MCLRIKAQQAVLLDTIDSRSSANINWKGRAGYADKMSRKKRYVFLGTETGTSSRNAS